MSLLYVLDEAAADSLKTSALRVERTDRSLLKASNQTSIPRTRMHIKREAVSLLFGKANFTLDIFDGGISCILTTNPLKTFGKCISYHNASLFTKISLQFCPKEDCTLDYWSWYNSPWLLKKQGYFNMVVKYLVSYLTGMQTVWILGDISRHYQAANEHVMNLLGNLLLGIPTIRSFCLPIDSFNGQNPFRTADSQNLDLLTAAIRRQIDGNQGIDATRVVSITD